MRKMGRKGEDKQTKRSKAPSFWAIQRKEKRFTVTTSPGPHGIEESYPLTVLIRDVLKIVNTFREASNIIRDEKIMVDGVVRKDPNFPVGLMDVLQIPVLEKSYRMVPIKGSVLAPIRIPDSENNQKLCKVQRKATVHKDKIQYGFHDGRSILAESETDLSPGDVCLLEIPSQNIKRVVVLKNDVLALVVKGKRVGKIGQIKEIRPGTITRRKMVDLEIEEVIAELPADMIIAVGDDKPLVTLVGGE